MTGETEQTDVREVERLRRAHPGWSIWYGRAPGYLQGTYHATPKGTDSPAVAAASASELTAAITAVEHGTNGQPSRQEQVAALTALARATMLATTIQVVTETDRPYACVSLSLSDIGGERVIVGDRDGAWAYIFADDRFTDRQAAYPVGDPARAVRRIVDLLAGRHRQARGEDR